jgi:hypothetical protein
MTGAQDDLAPMSEELSAARSRSCPAARRLRSALFSFTVVACSLSMVACGGGDDDGGSAAAAPSNTGGSSTGGTATGGATASSSNKAPVISGLPAKAITQGTVYRFRPLASDADRDSLVFSVKNPPKWATFSAVTGVLTGTPSSADVGTYENVVIEVSDGAHRVALAPFRIEVVATAAGSITISWLPPTERTDGSDLTNLAGYRIHWGPDPDEFSNSVTVKSPGVSRYVIEQLTPGTYYLGMTAFDAHGVESALSNLASKTIR